MLPGMVAHADWSTAPGKRWMVRASLEGEVYRVGKPEAVSSPNSLAESCVREAQGRSAVIGFDFPIGLPAAYAERAGIASFHEVLPEFGDRGRPRHLPWPWRSRNPAYCRNPLVLHDLAE